jgi:GAF domain-containing protein
MNNIPSPQPASAFDYKGWRETFINIILRLACILGVALIAFSFSTASLTDRILFIGIYVILLAVTLAPVKYEARAFTLLFMTYAIGVNSILSWGPWLDGSVFFIAFIALSSLLFDQRLDLVALGLSVLTFAIIGMMEQTGLYQLRAEGAPQTLWGDWAAYTIDFSIISAILIIAIEQLKREFSRALKNIQNALDTLAGARSQLENRVRERTEELEMRAAQLRSSASISRTIAELQNVSEVIEMTTRLASERFGYYQVGLYLLDEPRRNAFLQAASSAAGKELVGQGFRIEPDRLNPIHRVVEGNRPYFASDNDPVDFMRDPNFPLTRSRMILPLTVRGDVIGILDIHSDQPRIFNVQDAETLQTLADLVAISIDNVRLIDETKNLVRQLEAYTSAQTRENWSKFTSRQKPAYQYTPAGVRPLFASTKRESGESLKVPLTLHGQNIGVISLKRKGVAISWSERERMLVEKVATQVALALENSRLVDETQKRALRDQVIANISARVRENLNIESVLQTAATELRKAFDLKEAEISIGALQENPSSAKPLSNRD